MIPDPVQLRDITDWQRDAACRGRDPEDFHPVSLKHQAAGPAHRQYLAKVAAAKEVCGRCPVKAECLAFALSFPAATDHGIYGGTTERERTKMPRTSRLRCAVCDSPFAAAAANASKQMYCSSSCAEIVHNRQRQTPKGVTG